MAVSESTLLVCTVGGTADPVVAALKHWQPARVYFVHTPQTKNDIEHKVVPMARSEGVELDAGRYDCFELSDEQDFTQCCDLLRDLEPRVREWVSRPDRRAVVDFTGGTKCMSAAVALRASRWPCLFSYVGGTERTKDGVGVVVSGRETVLHQANPWHELGDQAVEEFEVLFDQRAFVAAKRVAEEAKKRMSDDHRKREFLVLENLAEALDAWDRFQHEDARKAFGKVEGSDTFLKDVLGQDRSKQVLDAVSKIVRHLDELRNTGLPSRPHVRDLLANARRRREEGRFDDGVARLYRAIEAAAQVALKERHGIESTEKVPLDELPEPLRSKWASRADDINLGLQDAYELLECLEDPLGEKFANRKLRGPRSPLTARNRSILAHGFEPVSEKSFDALWEAALDLADVDDADLPPFPELKVRAES